MNFFPARAVVLTALGLLGLSAAMGAPEALAGEADPTIPWMKLWNGKDLSGWNYLPELFKVENGMIVARGRLDKNNSFCATKQGFSDFELSIRARLWEKGLTYYTNTGILYRSKMVDEGKKIMQGYQLDIGDNVAASMYPEGNYPEGQSPIGSSTACKAAMKTDAFNHYLITADGGKVNHRLNGASCNEYYATVASGLIGLQLHAVYGPGSNPNTVMEADFKDIYIRPLNSSFVIPDSLAVYLNPDYSEGGSTGVANDRSGPGISSPGFRSTAPGLRTVMRGSRITVVAGPDGPRFDGTGRGGMRLTVFDPLGHALPAHEVSGEAVGKRSWILPGAAGGMKVIRISDDR